MSRLVVKTIKVRLIALEVVRRERADEKGGGRGVRAIRGATIASGWTIAAHSSSSIAIISTSSRDNIDDILDILDDRTHTTNPASYWITDQDHRSTLQPLRPRKGAEYTTGQPIRDSLFYHRTCPKAAFATLCHTANRIDHVLA